MFLKEKKVDYPLPHFPTLWQAVIFRNYGKVPALRMAEVLRTTEAIIEEQARGMGLSNVKYNPLWLTDGYLSLIMSNWDLLSYLQLCTLLDVSEKALDEILYEDDFLYVKAGFFKPLVEGNYYYPLSAEQKEQTKRIKQIVEQHYIEPKEEAFAFMQRFKTPPDNYVNGNDGQYKIKHRIIYEYSMRFGDPLLDGEKLPYDDAMLMRLSDLGINGVWMGAILSKLSPCPWDESLSAGYQTRIKNLNTIISRAAKYGIKVYLYFNEPRSMPKEFFNRFPQLKGATEGDMQALCTALPEVKEYLYSAMKGFLASVPDLGGIISITMSENLTNCLSRQFTYVPDCDCPRCKTRSPREAAVEVCNIITRAIKDSGSNAKHIAWTWGWSDYLRWSREMIDDGIRELDKDCAVMCVSEDQLEIDVRGVKVTMSEYSVSKPGPSEKTHHSFNVAREDGKEIFAKIQANNSWECAAVPYIPAVEQLAEHLNNLGKEKVDGLLLSWTLGGYPGFNLKLVQEFCKNGEINLDEWYKKTFKGNAVAAQKAFRKFKSAMDNFPLCLDFLYYGPHTAGPKNLLFAKKTGRESSMVGFCFDDIDRWRDMFSREKLLECLNALSDEWTLGVKQLEKMQQTNELERELLLISKAVEALFKSAYAQSAFIIARDSCDHCAARNMLQLEKENTLALYNCLSKNSLIGYEAANHYFFSASSMLEKLLNLNALQTTFDSV